MLRWIMVLGGLCWLLSGCDNGGDSSKGATGVAQKMKGGTVGANSDSDSATDGGE
jgi:hypothetical protein